MVAEPALEKALSFSDPNTVLLVCNVKRADYKGNSSYPYRTDKNIRLKTVPTFGVVRFPAMSVEMTLEEGDILKEDLMQDVLNAKL